MAAREMEIEVGFIRMSDLDIKPCRGCVACAVSLMTGGEGKCAIKDDLAFVDEQLMESDAVIASAPVYVLGASGLVKVVADRWGCSHDVYWRSRASQMAKAAGTKGPDERSFKHRVGAVMCTGHGITANWLSLGLVMMNTLMYPSGIRVVDQLAVFPGAFPSLSEVPFVENEAVLERARRLGRNVARAMQLPPRQVTWMGDEQGTCPVCHLDLIIVAKKNPVECPICGIRGELNGGRRDNRDLQRSGDGALPCPHRAERAPGRNGERPGRHGQTDGDVREAGRGDSKKKREVSGLRGDRTGQTVSRSPGPGETSSCLSETGTYGFLAELTPAPLTGGPSPSRPRPRRSCGNEEMPQPEDRCCQGPSGRGQEEPSCARVNTADRSWEDPGVIEIGGTDGRGGETRQSHPFAALFRRHPRRFP